VWVQQREYKAVGTVLAGARRDAGFTQQQLAKVLRKPQSFVSNYESGQRRLDVLETIRVADALGQNPEKVLLDILTVAVRGRSKPRVR
jgi:transcriptional regulator with XRE-family HTH domain